MARIVVVSFDDNDAAEAFVTHTLDAQAKVYGDIPLAISAQVVAHGTIEAVVARPTVSCRCRIVGMTEYFRNQNRRAKGGKFQDPEQRGEYVTAMGRWVKTEKFGWLVHDKCNRPGYFIVHRFIQNMLIGIGCNNLLPAIKEKMNGPIEPETTTGGDDMVQPSTGEEVSVQPTEPSGPEPSHDDAAVRD